MASQREPNAKPWGTLEELLLASAVNRHGTTRWDSVASEIHNRCSPSSSSLTPQDCRNKFYDLKRRFLSPNHPDSDSASLMPMLDELRKIRVEELRRDVQRRDVLVVSLEMKVKRLEEERACSFNEAHAGPDLEADAKKADLRPQNLAASGDGSDDRENGSLNESNSTSKKDDARKNWGNFKGSQTAVGDSNEAWESVSESKQEGKEGTLSKQQSGDVQSSGSLSQRKWCRNRGGTSSGEEPVVSPAKPNPPKPSAVKSEPLLKILDIIRSHRLGSAFERRLRSQESDRYKNLIRQHIDLRTIRSRTVKDAYADSIHRFFRDLLLLFNNAIIFFPRSSPENGAAVKLRALVLEEMKDKVRKPQPIVAKSKPKQEADLSSSKPSKPSTTVVGCCKRDSVALPSDLASKRAERNSRDDVEGKPKVADSSEIKIYEKGTWKKGLNLKETPRPTAANSGPRSSRATTSKNNGEVKHEYGGNELSSHDGMEVRMEKKGRVTKKKQGAVSFLKRMKQNSPSEAPDEDGDASKDDNLKEEEEEEEEEEDEKEEKKEEKRKTKKQKEGKRERERRSGGGGEGGRGKRGVGRPPKKAETVTVKRQQREEVGGAKPRKRSRR